MLLIILLKIYMFFFYLLNIFWVLIYVLEMLNFVYFNVVNVFFSFVLGMLMEGYVFLVFCICKYCKVVFVF